MKEPERPEIRVVRFVISIFKSHLRHYYESSTNWELGLRYCGAQIRNDMFSYSSYVDYNRAIDMFQGMYHSDRKLFTSFLEYSLNDFVKDRLKSGVYGLQHIVGQLADIENELLALGYKYDIRQRRLLPTIGVERQKNDIQGVLDSLLAKIDPDLVSKRQGAWEAFTSRNPDALAQSVSSARELLNQCITKLAPDVKSRKEKVKHIIGSKSGSELVESVADTVDNLYGSLSKGTHRRLTKEMALFTITTVENILYLLLTARR